MKECDKGKSHISNKLHMSSVSSHNGRHPVTKTFTTLHYTSPNYTSLHFTCRHFTSSHLNFTQPHHNPLIWLSPNNSLSVYRIFYSSNQFITKIKISNKGRFASMMWLFAYRCCDGQDVM
jgi:hypothetical protein